MWTIVDEAYDRVVRLWFLEQKGHFNSTQENHDQPNRSQTTKTVTVVHDDHRQPIWP